MRAHPNPKSRRIGGFTLVEMMVTVSVATILTVVAVPNMQGMMQRRQLEGAAGEVYANLLLMRSQAIEKNRTVFVNFGGSGLNWLYGLDDRTACAPSTAGDCKLNTNDDGSGGNERVYRGSAWKTVTLTQPFTGGALSFESRRGLPSGSGTIRMTSVAGEIDVSVSPIGYVSICSPQRLGGYTTC